MADGSVVIEVKLTDEEIEKGLKSINSDFKEIKKTGSNTFNNISNCVKSFSEKTINASKKISDMGKKISILSTGVITSGGLLANSAMSLESAVAKYVSSTNTATKETEEYKKVLSDINNAGYGEGYEDIADAMSSIKKQLKDIDSEGLKNVTEKAMALRDLFGYEVSESIRSVKAMMDNFEISADEAFNLIVEGQKQGLDFSNEMLDSINEYSVQFDKLGLTAEDMFNIFKSGADSGAFNLDKIGDAVKEFSIRVIDGSKTTIDGFNRIGLSADDMAKKFAKGGDTAKEAFIEVIKRLSKMDDEVEQSIAGVNLFGTMWEDLGPNVVESFSDMNKGISKNSDSMQKAMDGLYGTTKSKIETQLKRLKDIGAKFGEKMLPTIEKLIDFAEEFVEKLDNMTEAEMNNVTKLGLIVAVAGPAATAVGKITSVAGNAVKGIENFSQAIGVLKTNTKSSNDQVNKLAGILKNLTSPTGIAIEAIGLVTIALYNFTQKQTDAQKAAQEFAGEMANQKKSLEEYNQSVQDTLDANLSHIDSVENLKDELKTLVEENGKVKDGYKSRVDFILNELNSALGTEYKLNGDIIDSYKDLQKEIDTLVEKKRAEVFLSSYEEDWNYAIENQDKAIENMKNTYIQLSQYMQDYGTDLDGLKTKSEELRKLQEEWFAKPRNGCIFSVRNIQKRSRSY